MYFPHDAKVLFLLGHMNFSLIYDRLAFNFPLILDKTFIKLFAVFLFYLHA